MESPQSVWAGEAAPCSSKLVDGESWRRDVEIETGFASYSAYIEHHMYHRGPRNRFDTLHGCVEKARGNQQHPQDSCCLLHVSREEDIEVTLNEIYHGEWSPDFVKLVQAPGKNVVVQIVLWFIFDDEPFDVRFMDSVGLLMRIHPRYFENLFCQRSDYRDPFYKFVSTPFYKPDHVVLGNAIASMTRYARFNEAEAKPVVVIGCRLGSAALWENVVDGSSLRRFSCVTYEEQQPGIPIISISDESLRSAIWRQFYTENLKQLIEIDGTDSDEDHSLSYLPLLPLLTIDQLELQCKGRGRRADFTERPHHTQEGEGGGLNSMMKQGFRRHIDDSEAQEHKLQSYIGWQYHPRRWEAGKAYQAVKKIHDHSLLEARRLDTEFQDYQQLQTGILALEESRKSIEMSSLQILESKRG